jgi:hypothetical protein
MEFVGGQIEYLFLFSVGKKEVKHYIRFFKYLILGLLAIVRVALVLWI